MLPDIPLIWEITKISKMAITCHPPSSVEAFPTGFKHPGQMTPGLGSFPFEGACAKLDAKGILWKELKTCSQLEIASLFAWGGD